MYSLVNVDPNKEYGVVKLPDWKTVQDGLKRNLVAMLHHYRHNNYSVNPDHLLVKFLQSINVPLSLNSDRYYSNISANAMSTANAIGMTTPFGTGKLFPGVFFNRSVQEVVVAFNESFRIDQVEANWQNATPVRVLRHPFSSLTLQIPNGKYQGVPQDNIAVVSVNVSLLAVMYRSFVQMEQMKQRANPEYVQRNVMQFVHAHVLPNMLESYLDYALFNRMDCLWNDLPVYTSTNRNPIQMAPFHHLVDGVYNRLIVALDRSSYSAPAMLSAVPVVSVPDLRKVMFVPDVAPTRQILWSMILARLPMLLFLIRTANRSGRIMNQLGLHDVEVTLRKLKSQKVLDSSLPKELYQSTMASIDEIIEAL